MSRSGPAPVVRTRLGISVLPRAPFGNSFVLERPVLTASVGPAPAGGCSGSPFQQFFFVVLKVFEGANPAVGYYRGLDLAAFFVLKGPP